MGDPEYDVAVNVHKGQDGYGIYFTQRDGGIMVTKLDKGSEAERAGVQQGDMLVSVMDLDKVMPPDDPGKKVTVTGGNYQEALQLVRQMKYCRLEFKAGSNAF